jgi:hypothetical protein
MIKRYPLTLFLLFAGASHSESLFEQIKGQTKVTIGTTVTANNMARVITKGPILGNDFNSQALSAVTELRGDPEKALVFIAIDVLNMSATATDWEWRLLYQVSINKIEREFICERKFSVNWADAMWSWQRTGLAFKRISLECGTDFLSFLKKSPAESPLEQSNIEDQIASIANAQRLPAPKTDGENDAERERKNGMIRTREGERSLITPLDVIGLTPTVSTRDDVSSRSSKRTSTDTKIFQIGGFDLPCAMEFEAEKLSLLICTTGDDKSDNNIDIHNILKVGFTAKFGPPTLISNHPPRNIVEGSNSNEQLVWLDLIGNALVLFARHGKLTQGSMTLISADAIKAKKQSKDTIEKNRKF